MLGQPGSCYKKCLLRNACTTPCAKTKSGKPNSLKITENCWLARPDVSWLKKERNVDVISLTNLYLSIDEAFINMLRKERYRFDILSYFSLSFYFFLSHYCLASLFVYSILSLWRDMPSIIWRKTPVEYNVDGWAFYTVLVDPIMKSVWRWSEYFEVSESPNQMRKLVTPTMFFEIPQIKLKKINIIDGNFIMLV